VITGEGGSGGALALAVSDKIHMMENATFSVITPEGCASILFKDSSLAPKAAEALKLDAESVQALGVIDDIISKGRQILTHPEEAFEAVRQVLIRDLKALIPLSPEDLLETRYRKFRDMGRLKREMSEEDFAESSPTFRIAKPF
jgi:acetyl-CoA carboxylase carboxyl transferase subunit alpha